MRIAQVAPLYESVPPRLYGGTERVVSWLTEKLVKMGHDVTLFASADSVTNARLVPACKKALRLDPDCTDPIAHHALLVEQVFSQAQKFDLIHFHVDYLHFSRARCESTPCVTTLHGRLDIADLVPLYQEFREMPVVSISNSQREPLSWANWVGTVYHGMPPNSLKFNGNGGKYLAFLGRVSPEKGLDRAIQIAIRAGMPLKVAAKIDHADQQFFDEKIKASLDHPLVEFCGEIGGRDKSEFLGDASALIFPIEWPEPFGLVMIEAMACGTPVIAYPYGSVSEIIEDGVSGFVVHNIEEAVGAVSRIDEIDRCVCRRQFETKFTDERMAQDYVSIYQQLVGAKSGALAVEEGVLSWMEAEAEAESQTPSTT